MHFPQQDKCILIKSNPFFPSASQQQIFFVEQMLRLFWFYDAHLYRRTAFKFDKARFYVKLIIYIDISEKKKNNLKHIVAILMTMVIYKINAKW